jgi:hypothetical protein
MCTSAIAGPECKTYTMNYEGNLYTFKFSCETAGIGGVETIYNNVESHQWFLYLYDGDAWVAVLKVGYFELMGDYLYHIVYDYKLKTWHRTGFVLIEDTPEE